MTARPDVPDTPDRTDAIARVLMTERAPDVWDWRDKADAILTTDDPAAVAAIADQWAENHPEVLLDALIKAGVRRREKSITRVGIEHLVTDWREVTT